MIVTALSLISYLFRTTDSYNFWPTYNCQQQHSKLLTVNHLELSIVNYLKLFDSDLLRTTDSILYSGPSLSGHSQQTPPSLVRPQIFAAATINVFTSPSYQRPPL